MAYYLSPILALLFSLGSFGADPFTVMQGKDAKAPLQPQACGGPDGSLHLTFGVADQVYYCQIDEAPKLSPQAAFRVPNMSLGMRRGPRIAHSQNAITITAIGGAIGKGRDGDIFAYRSLDRGKSWLGPIKVNDIEGSAREGLHAMCSSENGDLWCVWLDLRDKGTKLFASKSTDDGATWSKNALVYRSPDGSICECCHPSIAASNGSVHVLFRNSLKGNRDMYLISSTDDGATFGNAVRLGNSAWMLNACPMDGGMLAIDKDQQIATTWRRDRSINQAMALPGTEIPIGIGEQPWIASGTDGFYTVWTSKRDGEMLLMKPKSTEPTRLDDRASFPVIVSIGGKSSATTPPKSTIYAFWEQRSDQGVTLVGQRID
ncbi:MAG: hypothetical protein RL240_1146 [Planctomycetota bacterium]|jgi:hypothetical protein